MNQPEAQMTLRKGARDAKRLAGQSRRVICSLAACREVFRREVTEDAKL